MDSFVHAGGLPPNLDDDGFEMPPDLDSRPRYKTATALPTRLSAETSNTQYVSSHHRAQLEQEYEDEDSTLQTPEHSLNRASSLSLEDLSKILPDDSIEMAYLEKLKFIGDSSFDHDKSLEEELSPLKNRSPSNQDVVEKLLHKIQTQAQQLLALQEQLSIADKRIKSMDESRGVPVRDGSTAGDFDVDTSAIVKDFHVCEQDALVLRGLMSKHKAKVDELERKLRHAEKLCEFSQEKVKELKDKNRALHFKLMTSERGKVTAIKKAVDSTGPRTTGANVETARLIKSLRRAIELGQRDRDALAALLKTEIRNSLQESALLVRLDEQLKIEKQSNGAGSSEYVTRLEDQRGKLLTYLQRSVQKVKAMEQHVVHLEAKNKALKISLEKKQQRNDITGVSAEASVTLLSETVACLKGELVTMKERHLETEQAQERLRREYERKIEALQKTLQTQSLSESPVSKPSSYESSWKSREAELMSILGLRMADVSEPRAQLSWKDALDKLKQLRRQDELISRVEEKAQIATAHLRETLLSPDGPRNDLNETGAVLMPHLVYLSEAMPETMRVIQSLYVLQQSLQLKLKEAQSA